MYGYFLYSRILGHVEQTNLTMLLYLLNASYLADVIYKGLIRSYGHYTRLPHSFNFVYNFPEKDLLSL